MQATATAPKMQVPIAGPQRVAWFHALFDALRDDLEQQTALLADDFWHAEQVDEIRKAQAKSFVVAAADALGFTFADLAE